MSRQLLVPLTKPDFDPLFEGAFSEQQQQEAPNSSSPEQPLALFTSLLEFANPYHDEKGRFTTGESEGGDLNLLNQANNAAKGQEVHRPGSAEFLAAETTTFGNDCHDPHSGEFCPTEGGSSAADETEASQDEYRGQHQPPRNAPTLDNLGGEDDPIFPADVYDHPEYYSHGGDNNYDKESARVLRSVRGKPDAPVKLYRAAPAGADSINKGDWVAISKSYAQMHAESQARPGETWHVYEITVPAKTVRNGGNDVIEWGYWGKDMPAKIVGTVNGDDYQAPEHFSLDTLMGRSLAAERVQWLETLSNTCHTPSGPGGGQFCGDTVDAGNLNAAEKKSVSAAFKAIEKVHELPLGTSKAYVEMSNSESMGSNTDGSYSADENRILLNEDKQNNAVTFVHEFGHHLSMGQGHSLQDQIDKSTSLRAWKDAVANSDTIQGLKERYDRTEDPYDGYLLDYREIFARSYAQWVTLRSGNKTLKNQFDALDVNMTWGAKEFEPIAKALDAHFKTARDRKAALSARLQEFSNPNHEPAGSPTGGRFAPKEGGSFGEGAGKSQGAIGVGARPVDSGPGGFLEGLLGPTLDTLNPEPPANTAEHFSWAVNNISSRVDFSGDQSTWGDSEKALGDLGSTVFDEALRRLGDVPGAPAFGPARDQALADLAAANNALLPYGLQLEAATQLACKKPYAQADPVCQAQAQQQLLLSGDDNYTNALLAQQAAQEKLQGSDAFAKQLAGAVQDVLNSMGPMGGKLLAHGDTKDLDSASSHFPSDWVNASNEKSPLIINQTDGRGYYNNDGAVINYDSPSTLIHELAHRMEYTQPWIKDAEYTFYQRRTQGVVAEPINDFTGGGYRDDEITKADSFNDPYQGKFSKDNNKPGGSYELFSMGTQMLFNTDGQYNISQDPDFRNFTIGLLAAGANNQGG